MYILSVTEHDPFALYSLTFCRRFVRAIQYSIKIAHCHDNLAYVQLKSHTSSLQPVSNTKYISRYIYGIIQWLWFKIYGQPCWHCSWKILRLIFIPNYWRKFLCQSHELWSTAFWRSELNGWENIPFSNQSWISDYSGAFVCVLCTL